MAIEHEPVEIAIVGGGVVGIVLAIGLHSQGIKVKVYEQSRGFREIGAGVAFTACARRCMGMVDPAVDKAFRSCGAMSLKSADPSDPNDYLSWVDGYNQRRADDPDYETPLFKIDAGYKGFLGARRDQLLEALGKALPEGVIEFRKRLESIREGGLEEKISLQFSDGTSAEADAVIGCDGLKSQVREYLFGEDNPASYVSYTRKFAYRGLVSMENAIKALGEERAKYFTIHLGPGAHMLHYPVANGTMINVVAFISDDEDWTDRKNLVKPALRLDVVNYFKNWNPCVQALASYFPENIDKWALFDSWDHPAPFFNRGKICLTGDAAHASAPHHGAGAGIGIEDALCISALVGEASISLKKNAVSKGQALKMVFAAYDATRRTRAQWFVNSSRRVCDLFQQSEWADPNQWVKASTCWEEVKDRSHKIWHFNPDVMVEEAIKNYLQRVGEAHNAQNGTVPSDSVLYGQASHGSNLKQSTQSGSASKVPKLNGLESLHNALNGEAGKKSDLDASKSNGSMTNGTVPDGAIPNGLEPGTTPKAQVSNGSLHNGHSPEDVVSTDTQPKESLTNGTFPRASMLNGSTLNASLPDASFPERSVLEKIPINLVGQHQLASSQDLQHRMIWGKP